MPRFEKGRTGNAKGRPRGSKDSIPRTLRASIKDVLEEVAVSNRDEIRNAILKGINAKPPHSLRYLEVIAHYVDGKPADTVTIKGQTILPPLQIFLHPEGLEDMPR